MRPTNTFIEKIMSILKLNNLQLDFNQIVYNVMLFNTLDTVHSQAHAESVVNGRPRKPEDRDIDFRNG